MTLWSDRQYKTIVASLLLSNFQQPPPYVVLSALDCVLFRIAVEREIAAGDRSHIDEPKGIQIQIAAASANPNGTSQACSAVLVPIIPLRRLESRCPPKDHGRCPV